MGRFSFQIIDWASRITGKFALQPKRSRDFAGCGITMAERGVSQLVSVDLARRRPPAANRVSEDARTRWD